MLIGSSLQQKLEMFPGTLVKALLNQEESSISESFEKFLLFLVKVSID